MTFPKLASTEQHQQSTDKHFIKLATKLLREANTLSVEQIPNGCFASTVQHLVVVQMMICWIITAILCRTSIYQCNWEFCKHEDFQQDINNKHMVPGHKMQTHTTRRYTANILNKACLSLPLTLTPPNFDWFPWCLGVQSGILDKSHSLCMLTIGSTQVHLWCALDITWWGFHAGIDFPTRMRVCFVLSSKDRAPCNNLPACSPGT